MQPTAKKITTYRPFIQLSCDMTRSLVSDRRLSAAPLVVADIGARAGFDPFWEIMADQCVQVGFEPDPAECEQLRLQYPAPQFRIENVALWEKAGTLEFHCNRDPNTSSCYRPNLSFFNRLPDTSSVETLSSVTVNALTLDEYCREARAEFDVIKVDVQGGELPILKGAVGQLDSSVLAVVAEVEFVELYQGQPLFSDLDSFMRARGFALFDLDLRRWRRKPLSAEFNGLRVGQTIYADALYLRDPVPAWQEGKTAAGLTPEKLLKLAALAELFSVPDYAMELLAWGEQLGITDAADAARLTALLQRNAIVSRHNRNIME